MSTPKASPSVKPISTEKLSATNLRIPFVIAAELKDNVAIYRQTLEKGEASPIRQTARDNAKNSALLADRIFEAALKVTGSALLRLGQEGRALCASTLNVIYTVANCVQSDADLQSNRVKPALAALSEAESALTELLNRARQAGLID